MEVTLTGKLKDKKEEREGEYLGKADLQMKRP